MNLMVSMIVPVDRCVSLFERFGRFIVCLRREESNPASAKNLATRIWLTSIARPARAISSAWNDLQATDAASS